MFSPIHKGISSYKNHYQPAAPNIFIVKSQDKTRQIYWEYGNSLLRCQMIASTNIIECDVWSQHHQGRAVWGIDIKWLIYLLSLKRKNPTDRQDY